MNILFLNKFYYLQGGSERVFFEEMELLEKNGCKTIPFSRNHLQNDPSQYQQYFADQIDLENKISFGIFKTIKEIIYSKNAKRHLKALLDDCSFDIAHGHNIYGLLTTSVLDELHERKIPTVLSLHDYKIICPNYQLFCGGKICEACKPHRYYHSILKNCVQENIFYSTIYCMENYFNSITGKYLKNVSKFIAVSRFIKEKFVEFGFPAEQIVHIPNFINTENISPNFVPGKYILYLGRLSKEKGIKTLIDACRKVKSKDLKLLIAGIGPLNEELRLYAKKEGMDNIEFKGYVSGSDLESMIQGAGCIVVPSEWYENCPMSVLEALAYGKPVIGADIGGIPELVEDEVDGLIFKSGDPDNLAEKLDRIMGYSVNRITEMGKLGRQKIETYYNAQTHYDKLMNLYKGLVVNNEK